MLENMANYIGSRSSNEVNNFLILEALLVDFAEMEPPDYREIDAIDSKCLIFKGEGEMYT